MLVSCLLYSCAPFWGRHLPLTSFMWVSSPVGPRGPQAVDSWLEQLEASEYRAPLAMLFAKYVDVSLEHCRRNFKGVVPLPAVNQAMTICKILEGILPKVLASLPRPRLYIELALYRHLLGLGGMV